MAAGRSYAEDNNTAQQDHHTNKATPNSDDASPRITRVSRACEPCRIRKTKCDISVKVICSECTKRNRKVECVIREKARPKRLPAIGAASGSKRPRYFSLDSDTQNVIPGEARPACQQILPTFSPDSAQHQDGSSYVDTFASSRSPAPPEATNMLGITPALQTSQSFDSQYAAPPSTSKHSEIHAVRNVQDILEQMASHRFGLDLSLAIPPEHVFSIRSTPRMTLEQIGLTPGDDRSIVKARDWINLHFAAVHHNTPFLHFPQIIDFATRFLKQPSGHPIPDDPLYTDNKVGNDEAALLLAILALGSFRQETWDEQRKSYRTLPSTTPTSTPTVNGDAAGGMENTLNLGQNQTGIIPLTLFRLAQDELDELDHPSEAAVQALFLLHTFVSNTSMGRRSKDFVARAIMMSHEIGLNRSIPMETELLSSDDNRNKLDQAATRRRAVLYLYVYFSDVYLAALDNSPPLIKRHDYSPDIFDPILYPKSSAGTDTPSGTAPGLSSFVDLVRTSGEMLEVLHGNKQGHFIQGRDGATDTATLKLVLQLDTQMNNLRERLGPDTFDIKSSLEDKADPGIRGLTAGKLLRQIHYNWFRIALRAPFLNHSLLGHSSLAICAVSALSLLQYHRHVINAGLLNLPWMQLRRITTAIHIIFIACWKGEITNTTASTAIDNALCLLRILSVRWKSATKIAMLTIDLAKRSDLPVQESTSGSVQPFDNTLKQQSLQPSIEPILPDPNLNTEQDLGTLFQLASNYIEQNPNRMNLNDDETEASLPVLPEDGTTQPLHSSAWPPISSEEFVWPQDSADFWADLIGPFG